MPKKKHALSKERMELQKKNRLKEKRKRAIAAIKYYQIYGVMYKAASLAGITRATISYYIQHYPKYKAKWDEAYQIYLDNLESIADERAKLKSDNLLKFLLKAGRREKYGDNYNNQVNINNNTNTAVNPEVIVSLASEIAKEMIKEGMHRRQIPTVDAIEIEYKEIEVE